MRWISKSGEPRLLTQWHRRLQGNDPNYGYKLLRQDNAVVEAVIESLLKEQGWLDAYTGQRIEADGCHIEHLVPQTHCTYGQDVDYSNLVACYPPPNTGRALYGAHQKDDWPAPEEQPLFVSPLEPNCEPRFRFSDQGAITPASGDVAAKETIDHLKLDNDQLTEQRRKTIQSVLKNRKLSLEDARRRLAALEKREREGGRLEPYCFAIKQALIRHIKRCEGMRAHKAKKTA